MTKSSRSAVKATPSTVEFDIGSALEQVRVRAPLVQNITNYVVMNSTANALLAVGASPAMVHAVEEVEEFVAISGALVINIGTLSPPWVEAMRLAAARAGAAKVPWVLDPVGAGATTYRTTTASELARMHPAVIRGNASEVMVVAGAVDRAGKGVDSSHSTDSALGYAARLARETQSIVAMTGVVDYVTDGQRVAAIENGHPLMAKVTGLGCTASALVGAFLAANDDRFTATVAALATLGVVGELAAAKSEGPGTLQLQILDLLYLTDRATLEAWAKVKLVAPPAA